MSPLALSLRFLQAQPDSRLVALARDGHEPAFEALVRRYRGELISYCRRLQPQSGSAEDAVQQTLLQAWRALRAGAQVRAVRPWLYRIAHNVSLNNLRGAPAMHVELPEASGAQAVENVVEQRLRAHAALAGMASLPSLQRQVMVSTTLDGASHEEVASALGLSSGAVRGLIYRARATLRAAAAAVTPSPVLNWAIRRADIRPGRTPAIAEALAGGGGAGVAAALAKGGAVLTLAGALSGAGGAILSQGAHHPRHSQIPLADSTRLAQEGAGAAGSATAAVLAPRIGRPAADVARRDRSEAAPARSRVSDAHGRDGGPAGHDHSGAGRGTRGAGGPNDGSRGRSHGDSIGVSDGDSPPAATSTSSDSSSNASSRGDRPADHGGSAGSSSGPSGGSTTSGSGSDGGTTDGETSDGGSPSSGHSQPVSVLDSASGGLPDADRGSSGGSTNSGSGDTTTTGPH